MATKTQKKKKAPGKRPGLASIPDDAKAEVFDKVAALEDERRQVETEVEQLRKKLKGKKETLAGVNAAMQSAIWEANHPEAHPIYAAAEAPAGKSNNGKAPRITDPAEAWRDIPLKEALPGLAEPILKKVLKIEAAKTLGGLTHWIGKHNSDWSIMGLTQKEGEQIDKQMSAFWEKKNKEEAKNKEEPAPALAEANGQAAAS